MTFRRPVQLHCCNVAMSFAKIALTLGVARCAGFWGVALGTTSSVKPKIGGVWSCHIWWKKQLQKKSPCFRLVTHRFFFPWQHVNTNRARPKSKAEDWRATEPKNADVTGWHNFSAIAFVMRSYQSYENLSLPFPPYLEVSTQDDVGSHHFIPNLDVVRFWEQVNCSKSLVDVFGPVLETRRRWYLLRPIGPSQGEPIPARARCADTTFQLHEADRAIEAMIMRT